MTMKKKVLIVGGGFGGLSAALSLYRFHRDDMHIALVNPHSYFEYHAELYRVMAGRSPNQVCIPYQDMLPRKGIDFCQDTIDFIDFNKQIAKARSGLMYSYDYLVLALGSETAYFNTPGLQEYSFSIKNTEEALRLKEHIHTMFSRCTSVAHSEQECMLHFVVVGGGPTGVELTGELAEYLKKVGQKHGVGSSHITLDLITASSSLVPQLKPAGSAWLKKRLEKYGVNVYLNRRVEKEEIEEVFVQGMRMKTRTVIWAAGVRGHRLYEQWGLPVNKKGQVKVDNYLRPVSPDPVGDFIPASAPAQGEVRAVGSPFSTATRSWDHIFIVGDGADTPYSGMARTALYDGQYVAFQILRSVKGIPLERYKPHSVVHSIPVGHNFAVSNLGSFECIGYDGWIIKRFRDLQFYFSILPAGKAIDIFQSDREAYESCDICNRPIGKGKMV